MLREVARVAFAEKAAFGGGLIVRIGDKLGALRLLAEHLDLLKSHSDAVNVNVGISSRIDAALGDLSADQAVALAEELENLARTEMTSAEPCVDSQAVPATSKIRTSDNPNSGR